jgi:hypothetical protein
MNLSELQRALRQLRLDGMAAVLETRLPASVLQRVSERGDETGIVGRLRGEIGFSLIAGKERQIARGARRGPPGPSPRPRLPLGPVCGPTGESF